MAHRLRSIRPSRVPAATGEPTVTSGNHSPDRSLSRSAASSKTGSRGRGPPSSGRIPASAATRRSPFRCTSASACVQRPWPPISTSVAGIPALAASVTVAPSRWLTISRATSKQSAIARARSFTAVSGPGLMLVNESSTSGRSPQWQST
jgi:hypothetical protein